MSIKVHSEIRYKEVTAEMRVETVDGLRALVYFDNETDFSHDVYVSGDRLYGVAALLVYMAHRTGSRHKIESINSFGELTESSIGGSDLFEEPR